MRIKTSSVHICICVLLFLLNSGYVLAQTQQKENLLSILKILEERHDVSFSFASEDIQATEIIPPNSSFTLGESLNYLNSATPFRFNQINERYITVVLPSNDSSLYCGTIRDGTSGLPLEGAAVVVGKNEYTTITDINGVFFVPNSLISLDIIVSHIGYETLLLIASDLGENCPTTLIQPEISQLNQVIVRSFLTKGINKTSDGSTVINTNNFGLLPGQVENDVLQLIQALPGIESVNETISNINIRGGTNDENLVLWDQIRMYQTGHFFGLITAFNPLLTNSVVIYKNGTPAHYGESVSGVIDLRSKDKLSQNLQGAVGFNLINGSVFLDLPVSKNLSLQLSGRRAINDVFQTPVYNTFTERIFQDTDITATQDSNSSLLITTEEDFTFFDFSGKLLWDISENDKLRFNFLTVDDQLSFTETIEANSQSETSDLEQATTVGGISWSRDWSNLFSTTVQVYASSYFIDSINRNIFTTQESFQENEVLETAAKIIAHLNLGNGIGLTTGYSFSETGVTNVQDVNLPRFRDFRKEVLRSHAVFGSFRYSPSDKTIINTGVRANYFDKFQKFIVEPRLHIHQKIGSGFAIEGAGEFKSQTMTQRIDFDSDFLGVEKRRWVLANDADLPIKTSKQASIGFLYNQNNWLVNIEGFYKLVEGVSSSSQAFQNQFQFIRTIGNYEVKGIEFTLNKKVNDLSIWLGYNYKENIYDFKDLEPRKFPNNLDFKHAVTVASSYQINQLKLAVGVNWHSGKPFTIPLTGEEIVIQENGQPALQFDIPNAERLSDYFRADISAEYLWEISKKVNAKFNLAVINIFDQKNPLNKRYTLINDATVGTRVNEIEELSLGWAPNFSFLLFF